MRHTAAKSLRLSVFALCIGASLMACRRFPEVDVSEQQFDKKTPYPEFVPLDVLLAEPEAAITDEVESDLTTRRDDLAVESSAKSAKDRGDPILDRIDALRAKRDAEASPIIDEAMKKRLEAGIKAPTVPE